MQVDAVDAALIAALRVDGRVTFEALAGLVRLSRTATRARVQRLVEVGAVRIAGVVHPSVYGLHTLGHIGVLASSPVRPIAARIAAMSDAPFISIVAGRFSIIAEVRSANPVTFAATLEKIRAIEGVERLDTTIYNTIIKDTYSPKGDYRRVDLDEVDRRLLAELQRDGRIAFAELAERIRLSPGAARARALRLIEHGAIHVVGLTNPELLGFTHTYGFALWTDRAVDYVATEAAAIPHVDYLATGFGRCDLVGTVVVSSLNDVVETMDRLRSLDGVGGFESWHHLVRVKEDYTRSPLEPADAEKPKRPLAPGLNPFVPTGE